ncbi:hypothetical protein ACFVAJ_19145 [Agromyces sp. NPDC057679]|uniref:hypothetical protein n=1 Tax=Agromyces sp. NPDC057679 TaxID=3346207 RepID=UPI00366EFA6D
MTKFLFNTPTEIAQAAIDDTPYNPKDRDAYRQSEANIKLHFADDLRDAYAEDLPEAVAPIIFERAWEDGHSSGYSEVESQYVDLAEFARKVRAA